MSEETVIIEGYQPIVVNAQDGYQPTASAQINKGQNSLSATPVAKIIVTPPKGGTGEVTIKK